MQDLLLDPPDMIAYMSDPDNQNAAQFYRLPDGQTVVVIESSEGDPLSALGSMNRRRTRRNARGLSKKWENLQAMLAIYFAYSITFVGFTLASDVRQQWKAV